eukprot:12923275-Prorocentrum_lima.AAC.1
MEAVRTHFVLREVVLSILIWWHAKAVTLPAFLSCHRALSESSKMRRWTCTNDWPGKSKEWGTGAKIPA